jgi:hypothetical protein
MRYISAEQSIAAAGAAFAWSDDEFRDVEAFVRTSQWSQFLRKVSGKMMLAMAFVMA